MLKVLKQRWHNRMQSWLDKRIPAAGKQRLSHQSIFIFPSKFGVGFLIMCVCLFILGTNYQNNLMLLLCYFLVALFLLNLFKSYVNFSKLDLSALPVSPIFAGHQGQIQLKLGLEKTGNITLPSGLLLVKWWQGDAVYSYDLNQSTPHISLPTHFDKRGNHRLPRVMCYTYFPLGLYRCWTYLDFDQTQLVYPNPVPTKMTLSRIEQDDDKSNAHTPGHDDFAALQPYRQGDTLNHVVWKQVAKGGDWVSKSFHSPLSSSGFLTLPAHYRDLELALSHLTFQVIELSDSKAVFGLKLGEHIVNPSSGEHHRRECLALLALYQGGTNHGE